jgi:membrane protease YdiL (CAAX protease family)
LTGKRALAVSVGLIVLYWVGSAASRLLRPHPMPDSVSSIAASVCVRTAIVVGLVWLLMRASGESVRELGVATDGAWRFLVRSLALAAGMFVVANVVLNSLLSALIGRGQAPGIAALFRDPSEAPYWIFSAIVGGGFAEELLRAFVLTRFDKLFGRAGLAAAVVIDSIVFGLGHLYQGNTSAVTSGITGALLALIFLQRRRVVDAMAVHALFDLMGIAAGYALYAR